VSHDELIRLPAAKLAGEKGSRLEAILIADSAHQRAQVSRGRLVALLALLSVPLWLVAALPGRLSDPLRLLSATLWALAAVALLVAMARTWWWRRVRSERVAELGPLPVLRSRRADEDACARTREEQD
jgi:hypothetical protein